MLIFKLQIKLCCKPTVSPFKTVLIFTCFTVKDNVNELSVAKTTFYIRIPRVSTKLQFQYLRASIVLVVLYAYSRIQRAKNCKLTSPYKADKKCLPTTIVNSNRGAFFVEAHAANKETVKHIQLKKELQENVQQAKKQIARYCTAVLITKIIKEQFCTYLHTV